VKIVIVTQDEPFFTQGALKKLLEAKGKDIAAIIVLPHYLIFGSFFSMLRYYSVSYGIRFVFSVAVRRFIRFTTKLIDHLFLSKGPTLNYYIKKFSIPMYNIKRLNNKILAKIEGIGPDLIISLSATQIFNKRLLNLANKGCINLHSAPLPHYRGLFPAFWQFLNGEREIGITVHFVNEQIDAGDILLQDKVKVFPDDSLSSLLYRVKTAGIQLLLKALEMIESNKIITIPNDITKGSYYGLPKREDIKMFFSKGKKFF
jgi:methionyl-tRNA formyltransferase